MSELSLVIGCPPQLPQRRSRSSPGWRPKYEHKRSQTTEHREEHTGAGPPLITGAPCEATSEAAPRAMQWPTLAEVGTVALACMRLRLSPLQRPSSTPLLLARSPATSLAPPPVESFREGGSYIGTPRSLDSTVPCTAGGWRQTLGTMRSLHTCNGASTTQGVEASTQH